MVHNKLYYYAHTLVYSFQSLTGYGLCVVPLGDASCLLKCAIKQSDNSSTEIQMSLTQGSNLHTLNYTAHTHKHKDKYTLFIKG